MWNDFVAGDELDDIGIAAGGRVCVYLKWDSWPTTTQDFDFSAFTPTSEGWGKGDRKVTCYAVKVDGTKLNTSIKKAS